MRLFACTALLSALTVPAVAAASTIDLSTGFSPYQVTGPQSGRAVVIAPNPGWHAQNTITDAKWINRSGSSTNNDPAGYYHYISQSFFADAGASVTGSFASDNQGSIYIVNLSNSTFAEIASNLYGPPYSFDTATPFTIGGLISGDVYNVTFVVQNGDLAQAGTDGNGPTGLLADVNASNVTATPEPSSLALLGTGVLSVAGFARRKFARA